jgi:hypothetical protein
MTAVAGFLVFCGATYGFGTVVGVLKAGKLVRMPLAWLADRIWLFKPLSKLVRCPPCLALWAGLLLSYFGLSPALGVWPKLRIGIAMGTDAFLAAGVTWLLHVSAELVSKDLEDV